jgi:hypothetical protein
VLRPNPELAKSSQEVTKWLSHKRERGCTVNAESACLQRLLHALGGFYGAPTADAIWMGRQIPDELDVRITSC